ncbi:MAG: hypothetical protein JWN02_1091, partial [Acidobacteria bacterium]|nr:hypothetical protein [Acidobacteriota bacterium]
MRCVRLVLLLLLGAGTLPLFAQSDDLVAARSVFERNIAAIRNKDREAFLALFWHSDQLVLGGPAGFSTGYEAF